MPFCALSAAKGMVIMMKKDVKDMISKIVKKSAVDLFIIMTIPFAALKAQKGMKPECRNAKFKNLC